MNDILKLTKEEKQKVMTEISNVLFPIQFSYKQKAEEKQENVIAKYSFHHTF